ncbi:Glycosyl hydrolase family 20, catalytic domain [Nesidiocoris tenuis]|uniref:beta-N-acetylhexosaminidase n=1 Tax=Nesidiocoris tenuis TaxID=355587 RepID=A0ABN7B2U7_9HEMI|nr:Glycosyl hydrolase family 20, catalytic domain [Nesidiocoris tenuis]
MEGRLVVGPNRLVHLDLKRAPLKVDYLEKLFPQLKNWGATGLLIEWEDTFPYQGELTVIGSAGDCGRSKAPDPGGGAYTEDDVGRILQLADSNDLMVVPLVQTFGHLEFVLRHSKYAHLREVSKYPSSICPSHPETMLLITSMIDQVIAMMPKSLQFFHIGADEVWHLGMCSLCSEQDKFTVLMNHLLSILRYFKERYPDVRPIMWDDMLRNVPTHLIKEYCISDLVDLMVWYYEPAPFFHVPEDLWAKYSQTFGKLWVASAFKGATGPCQILPVLQHHISNHEQWLSLLNSQSSCLILGIALTGWSRYDHYATLCELMPAAIPSLALCLKIATTGSYDEDVFKLVATSLGYTGPVMPSMNPHPRPQAVAAELNFPGWKIHTGIEWYANLRGKHQAVMSSDQVNAWLNPWQLKHNFTNPMQINGLVSRLFDLGQEWEALESYLTKHMAEAYYDSTIDEWLATLVHPLKNAAKQLYRSGDKQLGPSSGS